MLLAGYGTGVEEADKKRVVQAVVDTSGKGFAEEFGFGASNQGPALFQLLCLSLLLGRRGDYHPAVAAARALRARGWFNAQHMAASTYDERIQVLKRAGCTRDADELARTFGELARVVLNRYGGDLRRLRAEARRNPQRERGLLSSLPGVTATTADVFFREVQPVWPEVAPFADKKALVAARKLGIGNSAEHLARYTGGGGPARLAWLAGALARVEMDKAYPKVRRRAGIAEREMPSGPDLTSPRRLPGMKR